MTDQTTASVPTGQGGDAPITSSAAPGTVPPQAPSGSWIDSFDDEAKGFVQNKGWKDSADLLGSYRNLEKLTGAGPDKLLKLPTGDDKAEWDAFYTKLGRPESADGYKLPVPDGDDGAFAKTAAGWFHELGLTAAQAEKLSAKWNEHVGQMGQQAEAQKGEAYKAQIEQDNKALTSKWGAAYEQNINIAKTAAREFGFDGPTIDKLESALGFAGLMEFMHNVGSKIGEASFVSGDSGAPGRFGVMTPDQAKQQITALRSDSGFISKYTAGDAEAKAKMAQLHKWAYPEA